MRLLPNFKGFDFFPHDLRLPFMRYKGICLALSIIGMVLSLSIIGVRGFNYGVDFKGGSMLEMQSKSGPADIAGLREKLNQLGVGSVQIQSFGTPSDVLIYERIREEARAGRTPIAAIDAGFTRAFITIADSQLTTLACALVMFWLGSGPIRGFAVTLTIGICTSIFASVTVVRLLIYYWLNSNKRVHRAIELPV